MVKLFLLVFIALSPLFVWFIIKIIESIFPLKEKMESIFPSTEELNEAIKRGFE